MVNTIINIVIPEEKKMQIYCIRSFESIKIKKCKFENSLAVWTENYVKGRYFYFT